MDPIGENLGSYNALDKSLDAAPSSFDGESLDDSVACDGAPGTRVRGPNCVCCACGISDVDVETGVAHQGRDSGGLRPDRDAAAGHGLPQGARESLVFRDLNVDAGASVGTEEVANGERRDEPDVRGGYLVETICRRARRRSDEDERQIRKRTGGLHERLESLPTEVHVRHVAHREDILTRTGIRREEVRVEAERDRHDFRPAHTRIPRDFFPQGIVDHEDPIRVEEGVPAPGRGSWIDVGTISQLGYCRDIDPSDDDETLSAEEAGGTGAALRLGQREPRTGGVGYASPPSEPPGHPRYRR